MNSVTKYQQILKGPFLHFLKSTMAQKIKFQKRERDSYGVLLEPCEQLQNAETPL